MCWTCAPASHTVGIPSWQVFLHLQIYRVFFIISSFWFFNLIMVREENRPYAFNHLKFVETWFIVQYIIDFCHMYACKEGIVCDLGMWCGVGGQVWQMSCPNHLCSCWVFTPFMVVKHFQKGRSLKNILIVISPFWFIYFEVTLVSTYKFKIYFIGELKLSFCNLLFKTRFFLN